MEPSATSPGSSSSVRSFSDPEWLTAKRGLVTYRRALIISLIVGIAGGVIIGIMTVATATARGMDGMGTILWATLILAVVSLALSLWMLVGLVNYAKVPAETGARGLATVALVISGLGLLVAAYETVGLARVTLGGLKSLLDLAERSNTLTNIARLGQMVGFICLIVSLRRVASHVGADDVVRRIGSFITLVGITIGLFVLVLVLPHPVIALLGMLAMLVLVIIALVKFLSILQALGAAIGGLDVARVFD
jgi:hypothetical protein